MNLLRSGVLAAAVLGLASTAMAADMPIKGARVAPAPVWSWTGFYAGVHAGYGWGNDDPVTHSWVANGLAVAPLSVGAVAADNDGPIFGGHIGYNWQVAPNWVVGIEGDLTATGIRGSGAVGGQFSPVSAVTLPGDSLAAQRDVNWLATIRGRLGYAWGTNMIYFTGGAAWADIDYTARFTSGGAVALCASPPGAVGCSIGHTISDTRTGWVLGGGYEGLLAGNWLWRVEYLYYKFDDTFTSSVTLPVFTGANTGCLGGGVPCTSTVNFGDLTIQTVRLGVSYKFGQGASGGVYAQAPAAAVWSWTGFYAGVHAGYGWGNDDPVTHSWVANGLAVAPLSVGAVAADNDGPIFGGHIGYNWQVAPNWVVGIEGDLTATGIRGSGAVGGQFSPVSAVTLPGDSLAAQRDVNWLATIRGRLGYAWGTNMIYFTGGAAWADIDYTARFTSGGAVALCASPPGAVGCSIGHTISDTRTGWVLGGGYEGLLAGNWLWRVEYLYYKFDDTFTSSVTLPVFTGANTGCLGGGVPCTSTVNFGDLTIQTVRLGVSYKF